MKGLFHRLAIAGLLLVGFAPTPSAARESITVSRRHWFMICAGSCPNYDVTVWPDGRVLVIRGFRLSTIDRFRVSRAEAAEFRNKLLPFRPAGEEADPLACYHDVRPEEARMVMKVTEIEIKWSGIKHPARLAACDNVVYRDLIEAIQQAFSAVHLYGDGHRRD